MDYQFLQLEQQQQVATVWINRAELHNAFNTTVIEGLYDCFQQLNGRDDIRVVILAGRGKSFSAGADLNWMKQAGQASQADNEADALKLAKMLQSLATLKQPTIARVQGIAFGGGMGLASACDICVASTDAKFATSEVRLGLAPSTISPYVIRAIGARQASRYFLTAERLSAEQALQIGLAHEVTTPELLDVKVDEIVQALLLGGHWRRRGCCGIDCTELDWHLKRGNLMDERGIDGWVLDRHWGTERWDIGIALNGDWGN